MSARALDGHGRWRSKTIGVRVSPEENAEVNALAALSGMSKQEYVISRLRNRDVIVKGNPRVHKALKLQIEELCKELRRVSSLEQISPETITILQFVSKIYAELNNDD